MPTITPNESLLFDQPTRVLVVDDDPLLLEAAQAYLASEGAEVVTAPDGNKALELLRGHAFDVAVVDIEMPGLDGFELVERLRAQENLRHLPVVMLTVRGDGSAIDRAYKAGTNSYMTKPVNWRQLGVQLKHVIRASRMEGEALRPSAPAGWRLQKTSVPGGY
jgi:two-component system sensor histidine kinase/response regulator